MENKIQTIEIKPIPEYYNDFLDWLEIEKGLGDKTQENYARFIKKFFQWLKIQNLETLTPPELNLEHISNYRMYLARQCFTKKGEALKKSTQNYYLIALRSLLKFFSEKNIPSLPPDKVKLPKTQKERKVRFLRLEELERLFNAPDTSTIQGLRDRAILEVLFSTGMRISELVSLNRDQIPIKKNVKDLEISIVGKGGTVRPVYLSERAIFWLKKYLETRKDKEEALFVSYKGEKVLKRISQRAIQKQIKKYVIKAGLPLSTTPHVLRHTFATDLVEKGVDLRTIQEFLGHKTPLATQIYTHVTSKRLREVHRKFHSGRKLKI
jgi:site-specific recombinase XerD